MASVKVTLPLFHQQGCGEALMQVGVKVTGLSLIIRGVARRIMRVSEKVISPVYHRQGC